MSETTDTRLAVLIDADNISAGFIRPMIEEIARYGNPTIKRIYGDWTKPQLGSWKTILLDFAFQPVQQFGYTTGKNATDSAMIIDAMDILYSEKVEGFCIVSSDSDFTRLATRLREAGKIVYGIGEKKTPIPFIAACDRFIYLEILGAHDKDKTHSSKSTPMPRFAREHKEDKNGDDGARPILPIDRETIDLIKSSISDLADDNGWAFLGAVGSLILKKRPSFDSRNYGFSKLSQMIRIIDGVRSEERINEKNPQVTLVYIRNVEDE
ncbi:MAG: NYN domain-containing protein [Clostridiales bacterium]|nr:NYN domain-containing protein [Clostridiales bacterium]